MVPPRSGRIRPSTNSTISPTHPTQINPPTPNSQIPPMKKIVLIVAAALALMSVQSHAQGTAGLVITAGELMKAGGSGVMPNNMLIQLISDTSLTPGAPTANSFTGTDPNEFVLATGEMEDSSSGFGAGQGVTTLSFNINVGATGTPTAAGNYLFLRWYPTLAESATSPGAGTSYGQYNSTSSQFYPTDSSETSWEIPAAGSNGVDLWFITANQASNSALTGLTPNFTVPNSDGYASDTVAAIPEPATVSLLAGAFAIGAMCLRRRK